MTDEKEDKDVCEENVFNRSKLDNHSITFQFRSIGQVLQVCKFFVFVIFMS